jgi:hypothetical protein
MTTPKVTRVDAKMALQPERRDPPMWYIRLPVDLPTQPWTNKDLYNTKMGESPRYTIVCRRPACYAIVDTQHPDYDPNAPANKISPAAIIGFYDTHQEAEDCFNVLETRNG